MYFPSSITLPRNCPHCYQWQWWIHDYSVSGLSACFASCFQFVPLFSSFFSPRIVEMSYWLALLFMSVLLFSLVWVWRNLALPVSLQHSFQQWRPFTDVFIVCHLISDIHFHRIFFWSLAQSFSLASRWPLCRCLVSTIEFFVFYSSAPLYPIFRPLFLNFILFLSSGILVLSPSVTLSCHPSSRWRPSLYRLLDKRSMMIGLPSLLRFTSIPLRHSVIFFSTLFRFTFIVNWIAFLV